MKMRANQKGISLIELMITVAILGVIAALASRLYSVGIRAWLDGFANISVSQNIRVSRDLLSKALRRASLASVAISRTNTAQPGSSMVSFVDVDGNTQSFYQLGSNLQYAVNPVGTSLTIKRNLLLGDLERFYVYYPNAKDFSHIGFGLYVSRIPYADPTRTPILLFLQNVEELRNP